MNKLLPILIRAKDTADLQAQVKVKLSEGMDLYSPLFASEYGGLCQWMVGSQSIYEYALIDAAELSELEILARSLTEHGFDFVFNTVLWRGRYVQWMCRMIKHAAKLTNAERNDELKLVEDVQAVLQMDPRARGRYALLLPSVSEEIVMQLGERRLRNRCGIELR